MIFEIITAKEDGVIEIPWEIMEKAGFTESDIDNLEIIVDGDYVNIRVKGYYQEEWVFRL